MLKNYIKIAFRSLAKQKVYAFLNIFGLTIGITCSILIFLYVQDELTYDQHHSKADHIVRASVKYFLPNDGGVEEWAPISPVVPQYLVKDYPEIRSSVRITRYTKQIVEQPGGTQRFYQDIVWADSNVFQLFDFPLIEGDLRTALKEPYTMVMTQEAAMRYFGTTNVVGESLRFPDNDYQLKVTGVLEDIPANTHLKFEMLGSFETLRVTNSLGNSWWGFGTHTYLEVVPGTDVRDLEDKVRRISANYILNQETGSGYRQEYMLIPFKDIHLKANLRAEFETNGNEAYVYIFSFVGIFILIIASINFMNLATAKSVSRAKEVGVRKVVGAYRKHLIAQFLSESVFMAFLALLLSVGLILITLPGLNEFTGKEMTFDLMGNSNLAFMLLGITLFVGVVAGSYPAFVLSAFRPTQTLKGSFKTSAKGTLLRKGLVVLQFLISIGLIIATLIVFRQLDHMRNLELGFEKERIIFIPSRSGAGTAESFKILKDRLEQFPEINGVTLSSRVPGKEMPNNVVRLGWDQSADWSDMRFITVDYDFINIFDLELVAGRAFNKEFATDENEGFILNESGVNRLGFSSPEEAIGKQLAWRSRKGRVIGVLKDFYFMSVQNTVEPFIMPMLQRGPGYLSARIETNNFEEVVRRVEQAYREIMPDRIFEYSFLNDDFDRQYKAEDSFSRVFTFFAIVAIIIACLGLYGLAAYTAQQKVKEIGIRKVLGASVAGVVFLLSKDFVKLVFISFLFATPLAYYLMNGWLKDFAERVQINATVFLVSALISLFIVILTVSYQSIKVAMTNPIRSLRSE